LRQLILSKELFCKIQLSDWSADVHIRDERNSAIKNTRIFVCFEANVRMWTSALPA
jgi:hypothetical protein